MPRYDTITFLSDYGLADEFVGVVHSVIRSVNPAVTVVDLNHQVPTHDIRSGSLSLVRAASYLCQGVVLAVIDPGVGTSRRAIAVEVGEGASVLVGPDNGLLAPTVSMCGGAGRVVELTNEAFHMEGAVGETFAGRDVFAPVAAHLSAGVDLADLGPAVDPFTLKPGLIPLAYEPEEGGCLVTHVLWVDRFGNAQLNVSPQDVTEIADLSGRSPRLTVTIDGKARTATIQSTYGLLASAELGLVIDSQGLLALAFDRRSAADELGLAAGAEVTLSSPR